MARVAVPDNERSRAAGISLPAQLIQTARRKAYGEGKSLSSLVRSLLIAHLSEKNLVRDQKINLSPLKPYERFDSKEHHKKTP